MLFLHIAMSMLTRKLRPQCNYNHEYTASQSMNLHADMLALWSSPFFVEMSMNFSRSPYKIIYQAILHKCLRYTSVRFFVVMEDSIHFLNLEVNS